MEMIAIKKQNGKKSPTLKDVAKAANVSLATASLILRNNMSFSLKTRERVFGAAEKLKYRPNLLVTGMQSGKTYTVGVIVPPVTQFRSELLAGIHNELVAANHVPILVWPDSKASEPYRFTELEQIHRLVDRRVDGVILYPEEDQAPDDYLREVWDRGIPLVSVDREMAATHADFVGMDDRAGAKMVAQHLLRLGHKHFAYVSGVPATATTYGYRLESFRLSINKKENTTLITTAIELDRTFNFEPIVDLLKNKPRPTAVFAGNDNLAVAVLKAAGVLGLNVPQDLSIVGFGDLDVCLWVNPTLTSIKQFPRMIGHQAAQLVLQRSLGQIRGTSPRKIRIPPKLVVRNSTAISR